MKPIFISPDLNIRQLQIEDTDPLFSLVSANREHLLKWLPEDSVFPSLTKTQQFISPMISQWGFGDPILKLGVWYNSNLAGLIQCSPVTKGMAEVHIGYWLGAEFQGKGLISRGLCKVIDHIFDDLAYQRVIIQCALENVRSRNIPERLRFKLERIRPNAEWVGGRYVDHAIYAMRDYLWRQESLY